jgi:DNA modification methylase
MTSSLVVSDAMNWLDGMPGNSAQCCVTSPPYFGLRDYGHAGQIGLEETPDAYVARLVDVFREVRRVLRDDGTLWLNLGDSYASGGMSNPSAKSTLGGGKDRGAASYSITRAVPAGYKPKDLLGIPWMVAFALRADGWFLRSDVIWHKPNPMPESVRDRPTKAHEYVFLLTKSVRYFYDAAAIAEPFADERMGASGAKALPYSAGSGRHDTLAQDGKAVLGAPPATGYRNARSIWTITPKPYRGAHFATMPPDLARRCVLAGSRLGSLVIDPFAGAGTTLLVAQQEGREWAGCDLNPDYVALAEARLMKEMLGGAT